MATRCRKWGADVNQRRLFGAEVRRECNRQTLSLVDWEVRDDSADIAIMDVD